MATDKTLGHCKICYFEQPHLTIPNKTKSKQHTKNALFAQCQKWLPQLDEFRNWLIAEEAEKLLTELMLIV